MGDGAYDGEPVAHAVLNQQPNAQVVVPPHKNAICSDAGSTQRDQHIQTIAEQGRIAWQRKTGYNLRSYVELAMQRYKRIFGNTMKPEFGIRLVQSGKQSIYSNVKGGSFS